MKLKYFELLVFEIMEISEEMYHRIEGIKK